MSFLFDLVHGPESKPPQYRNRRTPALNGVLEQERRDQGGQCQPVRVNEEPQRGADEC